MHRSVRTIVLADCGLSSVFWSMSGSRPHDSAADVRNSRAPKFAANRRY